MPLLVDFTAAAARADEGPFRQIQPRMLATPTGTSFVSMQGDVAVPTVGGVWGATKISSIESLLVWSVLLPEGAQKGDVTLEPGTRLYFSVRVWKSDEVARLTSSLHDQEKMLEAERSTEQTLQGGPAALKQRIDARKALEGRVDRLSRGLPPREALTTELAPGPQLKPPASDWSPSGLVVAQQVGCLAACPLSCALCNEPHSLTHPALSRISNAECRWHANFRSFAPPQQGQLSVRRVVDGLRLTKNPFDMIRPNSFGQSEEWGVVGSFQMVRVSE